MHIAIHSASEAVTRTLDHIIRESGHHVAVAGDAANLVLVDSIHPANGDPIGEQHMLLTASPEAHGTSIACPLRPERLLQRLMMLSATQTIALGDGWSLDMLGRLLQHRDGATLAVTEKESSLLYQLAKSHPEALPRDALLEQVWGMAGDVDTHTLETHIYRLRSKLSALTPPPCDILTMDGAYALALNPVAR